VKVFRKWLLAFLARPKHYLRWALIHTALIFFFADLLTAVWPEFEMAWGPKARLGVALAALFATMSEYLHEGTGHDHKE
jgi:hypothetical protein